MICGDFRTSKGIQLQALQNAWGLGQLAIDLFHELADDWRDTIIFMSAHWDRACR